MLVIGENIQPLIWVNKINSNFLIKLSLQMSNSPKLFINLGAWENLTGILSGGINMVAELNKARTI